MSVSNNRDASFLKENFGVIQTGRGWSYEGKGRDDMADKFTDSNLCYAMIWKLKEDFHCDKLCILTAEPVFLILNSKPPFATRVGLSTKSVSDLIMKITRDKKQDFENYMGLVQLDLP